jgi:hypothetical protein
VNVVAAQQGRSHYQINCRVPGAVTPPLPAFHAPVTTRQSDLVPTHDTFRAITDSLAPTQEASCALQ